MTKHTIEGLLPPLPSVNQVAEVLQADRKTVYRRIADGTLTAHRKGPRCIRIERDSVLKLWHQTVPRFRGSAAGNLPECARNL
jgi:excisionase family DNA binding protein